MSGERATSWCGTTVAPATRAPTSLRISGAYCCELPSRGPLDRINTGASFLTREQIVVCSVPHGSRYRFDLLMKGEIEGTTLTEPYVTLAEKKGCRVVCSAFYHGTQVGTDRIDVDTMRAYNRAVSEAVRRI